jgi:hypothetical protein
MSRIVDLLILTGLACVIYSFIVKIMGKDLLSTGLSPQPGNYLQLALVIFVLAIAITLVQIRDRTK